MIMNTDLKAKWQVKLLTQEALHNLHVAPKVILSRPANLTENKEISSTHILDRNVPDLSDIANYVECTTCEEDIYLNDKNDKIEQELEIMFEHVVEQEKPKSLKKRKSKKTRNLNELLIQLFGSTLDDVEIPSKKPKKIEKQRRHTLPVSINIPNSDFLKPVKVQQKRKSETDAHLPMVCKVRKTFKVPVFGVEQTVVNECEISSGLITPPVYTETAKNTIVPSVLNTATVTDKPCLHESVKMNTCSVIDLTKDDGVVYETTTDVKREKRSEQASVPVTYASMPSLSPVSPAEPTRAEAVLPEVTTRTELSLTASSQRPPPVPTRDAFEQNKKNGNLRPQQQPTIAGHFVPRSEENDQRPPPVPTKDVFQQNKKNDNLRPQQQPTIAGHNTSRSEENDQLHLTASFQRALPVPTRDVLQQNKKNDNVRPQQQPTIAGHNAPRSEENDQLHLTASFQRPPPVPTRDVLQQNKKNDNLRPQQQPTIAGHNAPRSEENDQLQPQTKRQCAPTKRDKVRQNIEKIAQRNANISFWDVYPKWLAKVNQIQEKNPPSTLHNMQQMLNTVQSQPQTTPAINYPLQSFVSQPRINHVPASNQSALKTVLSQPQQQWGVSTQYQPCPNVSVSECPLPQMVRLLQASPRGYQIISNSTCGEKIAPYVLKLMRWKRNADAFWQENTRTMSADELKEDQSWFLLYTTATMDNFGKRLIKELLPVDILNFGLNEVLTYISLYLMDKSIEGGLFRVCSSIYLMIKTCENLCNTPFTRKFFNAIKIANDRLEQRTREVVTFTPEQLKCLEAQIQKYHMIRKWYQTEIYRATKKTSRPKSPKTGPKKKRKERNNDRSNGSLVPQQQGALPPTSAGGTVTDVSRGRNTNFLTVSRSHEACMLPPQRPQETGILPPQRPQEAGILPPQRSQGTGILPHQRSQETGILPHQRSQGTGTLPPQRSQGTGILPPQRSQGTGILSPQRSQETCIFPIQRSQDTNILPPQRSQGTSILPPQRSRGTSILPSQRSQETTILPIQRSQETSIFPIQRSQETSILPIQRSQETSILPLQRSQETSILPPQRSQETDILPPQRSQETVILPPQRSQETVILPPQRSQETVIMPPQRSQETGILPPQETSSLPNNINVPESIQAKESSVPYNPNREESCVAEDVREFKNVVRIEDSDEVVDLTWIDDADQKEIIEETIEYKVFPFKIEDYEEGGEGASTNREVISPADSGLGSPVAQSDDGFKCLCGNRAIYVCACNSSMYCSQSCQEKDWIYHQRMCNKMKS